MDDKYDILIEDDAKLDIAEAFDYYSKISNLLADKFINDIEKTMKYIVLDPAMFKVVYNGYRQVPVKKFPYVILYKFDKQTVKTYRVFPTRKNPEAKFG